jgi:hypothetical protein
MGIQNYLIDKKIRQSLKKFEEKKEQSNFLKINTVAIFVDEKSTFDSEKFRELQRIIGLDETHFYILTLKEKKTSYNEFSGTVIFKNEINWQGKITSKDVKEYLEKTYDILIDYTQADTTIKQLIVSNIDAIIKVGYSVEKDSLYNFMIHINPTEIESFNKELVRYLKILKLIDNG